MVQNLKTNYYTEASKGQADTFTSALFSGLNSSHPTVNGQCTFDEKASAYGQYQMSHQDIQEPYHFLLSNNSNFDENFGNGNIKESQMKKTSFLVHEKGQESHTLSSKDILFFRY